ncbi:hypothetical protein MMA231_04191 (plasmid) [Asticcacaulis sp. MM231]
MSQDLSTIGDPFWPLQNLVCVTEALTSVSAAMLGNGMGSNRPVHR